MKQPMAVLSSLRTLIKALSLQGLCLLLCKVKIATPHSWLDEGLKAKAEGETPGVSTWNQWPLQ